MRQIPKEFDILGHTIRVRFRDDLLDDAECHGRFIPSKNLIELQSGQAFSFTLATFWHECMHAICAHMGMKDIDSNEDHIDALGQGVAQILKTKRGKA